MLLTELILEGVLEVTSEGDLKVTTQTQEIQANFINILTEVEDKVTSIEVEDKADHLHFCIIQTNMD